MPALFEIKPCNVRSCQSLGTFDSKVRLVPVNVPSKPIFVALQKISWQQLAANQKPCYNIVFRKWGACKHCPCTVTFSIQFGYARYTVHITLNACCHKGVYILFLLNHENMWGHVIANQAAVVIWCGFMRNYLGASGATWDYSEN